MASYDNLLSLLAAAVCPNAEYGCRDGGYPERDPSGEAYLVQCQWCHERDAAIAYGACLCDLSANPSMKSIFRCCNKSDQITPK